MYVYQFQNINLFSVLLHLLVRLVKYIILFQIDIVQNIANKVKMK